MWRCVLGSALAMMAWCGGVHADDTAIGVKCPEVKVTDLSGKVTTLAGIKGDKATVLVFMSFECPVSNSYASMLETLSKDVAGRGVKVIAVCPCDDSAESLRKAAGEFRVTFPIYRDPKAEAAAAVGATITPEACVFDEKLTLRYRGRIDDTYVARLKKNARPVSHELRDAVDAMLAGRPVSAPVVAAVGCPIQLPEGKPNAPSTVTFHADVAPILNQHCAACHRPNEVGPFSLQTYAQAKKWANDIKEYTQTRAMPPWLPQHGVPFKNERRLSDREVATLAAWVDGGAAEGVAKPQPVDQKAANTGWRHGPPDLVLTVPDEFQLGATGADLFRVFVIPTGLTEGKWVVGYDLKPGNRRVVHHTLNFFDATGKARALEERAKAKADPLAADRGPGYTVGMGGVGFLPPARQSGELPKFGGIGGWAPGQQPQFLVDGAGWYLPAKSDFLIQVHYHRDGKPAIDRTQVGLYFAKGPINQPWQTVVVPGMKPVLDKIPAGSANHELKGSVYLHADADLHSVMPHMHLLGKSVKVTMTPPGGQSTVLVDIPAWDYNWQETYWFKTPVRAPAGTRLDVAAVFDNSSANPNNPHNPPKDVYQGEQTTNEMLFAFIGATSTTTPWQRIPFRSTPPRPTAADGVHKP